MAARTTIAGADASAGSVFWDSLPVGCLTPSVPTMKRLAVFFAALLLALSPAYAQVWTGPDPERRPRMMGQGDIDFVLSELCFPYILQNTDAEELVRRHRLPQGFGSRGWSGGKPFYLVGQADVWVSFDFSPLEFSCSIRIGSGDVAQYRAAIEARLATWPAPLRLSTYQHPLGNFRERLLYCDPAGDPHNSILISLQGPGTAVMMTVLRRAAPPEQCDSLSPD